MKKRPTPALLNQKSKKGTDGAHRFWCALFISKTMTYLIDSHQDIACSALSFNRDICLSAQATRKLEIGTPYPTWNNGEATIGWPDYQAGKVAVIFATLFIAPAAYSDGAWDKMVYHDSKEAQRLWHDQIDYYQKLTDQHPDKFRLIYNRKDLAEVLAPWQKQEPDSHPVGLVLLMEGAEGLREPAQLAEYYELGLRQLGPVWAGTCFCGGTKEDRPFDKEGRELLEVMSSLGIALDISHMREKAALTALDLFDGHIFASHANARALLKGVKGERHLTDAVIHRLQERNGVIGVVPYNKFLSTNWTPASDRKTVTIKDVAAQIDYYCQASGNSLLVGIGSDFDGGFGYPNIPFEMDTIADLQKLKPVLAKMGYTAEDIENIFNRNWNRHLETILPE